MQRRPAGWATDPNGAADNRVILVNPGGNIVWQYVQFGVTGSGPNELNTPDILITDQANQRIIEVSWQKDIVWQYGTTGVAGIGPNELNNPNSAELLEDGHILIADENNNRAIEVDRAKKFTAGGTHWRCLKKSWSSSSVSWVWRIAERSSP
jgi:hypothetical protein